jgi:hypothetical protein
MMLWTSKAGQKSLRDRVERNFPEFIARVPGGMLGEVGLKRHYKTPEPVDTGNAVFDVNTDGTGFAILYSLVTANNPRAGLILNSDTRYV